MKIINILPVIPLMIIAGVLNIVANLLYWCVVWLTKPCNNYMDYLEEKQND